MRVIVAKLLYYEPSVVSAMKWKEKSTTLRPLQNVSRVPP